MNAPTIGRIEFAPYVVSADALKREQARSASLLAALRAIVAESDMGCRDSGNPARDADRLAALFSIRHLALDAIFKAKE